MNETEPELVHRERHKGGPIIAMGLLVIPLLYLLSPPFIVPLIPERVIYIVYYPLIYLSMKFPVIDHFYNWYASLFPWN